MNIIKFAFSEAQYLKQETKKVQIYLHHTAGNSSAIGVAKYWGTTKDRVATSYIIAGKQKASSTEKDGDVVECFDSKYWAYHLGLKQQIFTEKGSTFQWLDKVSIGIEVCCWGQLTKQADGTFKNYVGGNVPKDEVVELEKPFRGFKFYHSYTDAQIKSLKELLLSIKAKHNIDLTYHDDIWDICKRALDGKNGVFTHNSVRKDKVDMYPHPKVIEMLKTL